MENILRRPSVRNNRNLGFVSLIARSNIERGDSGGNTTDKLATIGKWDISRTSRLLYVRDEQLLSPQSTAPRFCPLDPDHRRARFLGRRRGVATSGVVLNVQLPPSRQLTDSARGESNRSSSTRRLGSGNSWLVEFGTERINRYAESR